jgi:hypothetical protein
MGKARKHATRKLARAGDTMEVDGGGAPVPAAGGAGQKASGTAAMDTTDGPPRPAATASRSLGIAVR